MKLFYLLMTIIQINMAHANQGQCSKKINELMDEKSEKILNGHELFLLKAVSLANLIEKKEIWKNQGEYYLTQSGKYKAIFSEKNRTLIYFSSGNAFVEGFKKIEKNIEVVWCSNE